MAKYAKHILRLLTLSFLAGVYALLLALVMLCSILLAVVERQGWRLLDWVGDSSGPIWNTMLSLVDELKE